MLNPVTGRRRGFTLVELALALSIFTLIIAMAYAFQLGANKQTARTSEHSEALRSVMVALESMRRDLEQMLFQCPQRDLALIDHPELGKFRGLSLRIPSVQDPNDLWGALHVPVSYELRKVTGRQHTYNLVRKETQSGQETVLKNCLLRDMLVNFIRTKAGGSQGLSAFQSYLEISLIGLGSPDSTTTYTASMMVPLALMSPAGLYTVKVPVPSTPGGP